MGLDAAMGVNMERHRSPQFNPWFPRSLVGWWKFSSKLPSQNMWVGTDGTTAVNADGDRIGRILNSAPGNILGQKMGFFARALTELVGNKPVYKTGGLNGQSYAEYTAGGAQVQCLISGILTGEDATDWGGIASDKLSDLIIDSQSTTVFAVIQTSPAADTRSKYYLYYRGHCADGADEASYSAYGRAANEKYTSAWVETDATPSVETLLSSSVFADTDSHLITTLGDAGANNAIIRVDQVEEDTETLDNPILIDFDSDGAADTPKTGAGQIGIGAQTVSSVIAQASLVEQFNGRIYEILVYDRALSTQNILIVENYLKDKYDI